MMIGRCGDVLQRGRLCAQRVVGSIALIFLAALALGVVAAQEVRATLIITSPKSQETIHDNTGKVPVTVAFSNGGRLAAGEVIHVVLDGRRFGAAQHKSSFVLENVDRGEHRLEVRLVDASGKEIGSSGSVTFYMWRASVLFPGRS